VKKNSRLVLGTAQLGMNYGVANTTGRPGFDEAVNIVKLAWEGGIREFDTAQAYGESEKVLGQILSSLGIAEKTKIISKFHPSLDHLNHTELAKALSHTLRNLGISSLYGVMLHSEEFLDQWKKGLGEILSEFIISGLVEHVGVSVYSPDKAIQALDIDGIGIVQLPSNLLDRRFEKTEVFRLAEDMGKNIYVRSVFLQGLLLMKPAELPLNMTFALTILNRLEAISGKTGLTKRDLALGFAKYAYPTARIVFGVETSRQLKENLKGWRISLHPDFIGQMKEEFNDVEERILSPKLW
jgi:aryl-alcohol dehydrogenase-like predicted oxidoreductase